MQFGNAPNLPQPPGGFNSKIPISFAGIRYPAREDEQITAD
jgi:hypothetical protein